MYEYCSRWSCISQLDFYKRVVVWWFRAFINFGGSSQNELFLFNGDSLLLNRFIFLTGWYFNRPTVDSSSEHNECSCEEQSDDCNWKARDANTENNRVMFWQESFQHLKAILKIMNEFDQIMNNSLTMVEGYDHFTWL